ncbi:MAG: bifunctional DNA-formamidopyrimidine glycosylase/DNA-(apurinic or apyrimidinic site) lyase [Syntrophomonadaceae bacterium]|nr:bifunctional DNA-formamidopyrimidine glycosylase/DNA-(apurinic or apyrimidinic site) lyase [Syntrophomonadaceae bacterium]
MPELPEVETVKRSLLTNTGAKFISLQINHPAVLRRQDFKPEELCGKKIKSIERRGKYLILSATSGLNLIVHLGMSGRFFMLDVQEQLQEPHIHAQIVLDNQRKLLYQDARRFGGLWLVKDLASFFNRMGKEPLGEDFNAVYLADIIKNRKVAIKGLLLNQNLIAGIGNIYADEALFRAGILPSRPAGSLNNEEIIRLSRSIKDVLQSGIEQRGTTFRDYRDGNNEAGNNQNNLQVYGRKNMPCPVCGQLICCDRIGGRSSHYCEHCQL